MLDIRALVYKDEDKSIMRDILMKKMLITAAFCLILAGTALALGRNPGHGGGHHGGNHPGGGGAPEPLTILMVLAGGGAAVGIKKFMKK